VNGIGAKEDYENDESVKKSNKYNGALTNGNSLNSINESDQTNSGTEVAVVRMRNKNKVSNGHGPENGMQGHEPVAEKNGEDHEALMNEISETLEEAWNLPKPQRRKACIFHC